MASIEELSLSDHEDAAPQLVAADADLEKVVVRPVPPLLSSCSPLLLFARPRPIPRHRQAAV